MGNIVKRIFFKLNLRGGTPRQSSASIMECLCGKESAAILRSIQDTFPSSFNFSAIILLSSTLFILEPPASGKASTISSLSGSLYMASFLLFKVLNHLFECNCFAAGHRNNKGTGFFTHNLIRHGYHSSIGNFRMGN